MHGGTRLRQVHGARSQSEAEPSGQTSTKQPSIRATAAKGRWIAPSGECCRARKHANQSTDMRSRTPDRPLVLSNEKGPLWWCNSARRRGARSVESRGCVPLLPLLRASAGLSPSSGGHVHPHSAAQARRRAPRKISSVRPNRRSSPSTAQNPVARGPWGLVEDGAGRLISVCGGRWTREHRSQFRLRRGGTFR